ncbi:Polyamine aminopropyltransferase [subsurface metagenome]
MTDLYPGFLLPIRDWITSASRIPQQSTGDFRIIKRAVKAQTAWPMFKTLGYDYCIFMDNAALTLLQEKNGDEWNDWMVDSPYEWYAMGEYAMRTRPANVLVGGLGLGLVLHHLTLRKDVEKVTVIELNKDVIKMVSPYVPNDNRIEIVHGDFFKAVPQLCSEGREFNTIIVDIWAGEDADECTEDFENAWMLLNKYYPNALYLFHSFQKSVDNEIIAQYLPYAERPIQFVRE